METLFVSICPEKGIHCFCLTTLVSTTQPHGEGHVQSINLGDLEQFRKYVEDLAEKEKQPDLRPSIDPGAGGHEPEDPTVVEADNLVELTNTVIDTVPSVPVHEIRLDELPEMKSSRVEDVATQTTKYLTQPMEEEEDEVLHHRPTGGSVLNSTLCEEDFVLSIDEPPDAADLRRQMIDYNLHDIGAVVAELELESGDDDDEDEDDEDEGEGEGDDEDDDDNEEEDKYGRTTSRIITTDLEREMQALQARIRERQESEKTQNQELGTALELPNAAQVRISPEKQEAPPPSKKKGVTFSEKLEVAVIPPKPKPEPQGYILPPSPTLDSDDAIPFLVDLLAREQVKEDMRNAGWDQPGSTAQSNGWGAKIKHDTEAQTKKVSKFKASRIARTTEDQDPEAKARTSADRAPAVKPAIIERQSVSSPSPAPPQATVHGKPEKSSLFETSKIKNTEPSTAIFNNPSVGIHKNTVAATSLLEDTMGLVQDEADKPLHPLLAPKIIEKPPTVRSSPGDIPLAPSELDHTIHRQEVAVEYFKVRNRMIQKEGGFLPREEEEMFVPVDDGKKKVSRFKAARISMGKVSPQ